MNRSAKVPMKDANFDGLYNFGLNLSTHMFSRRSTASSIKFGGSVSASTKIQPIHTPKSEFSGVLQDDGVSEQCGEHFPPEYNEQMNQNQCIKPVYLVNEDNNTALV